MLEIVTILYDDFETLDVFGPIEVLGSFKDFFKPNYYSINGGIVTSSQAVEINTKDFSKITSKDYILFVPGGMGTRKLIHDKKLIAELTKLANNAKYIFTVCTGSSLFSQTKLLNGKRATSNKKALNWTKSIAPDVIWIDRARWVKDDNIYTSSGVSAGIDMSLGFIADLLGYQVAKQKSIEIEYSWQQDPSIDEFADFYI
ncbi:MULTISPECIES: DJ-1/PfpI family protein [Francisella]|uniref:DJ-1/PfpI family protein n=1 Tax=Francisella opportunistica TaxID=2016517 RepID=A0A345JR02_9GAMM|nr:MULTISPECIES: DJ-1/PfpI family protein [Francisella]APC91463.1 ThiJ/PfpI family protein [Francisella sp. MA067296]AXH29748.1 DJ-1/PfpI family protein [Francisella opportunistica]AXH31398.1 dimethyladenosine transferase [Francisella opportunistica]AXH33043.1 dimethyladenosine transferase [Francisella opportunistica]